MKVALEGVQIVELLLSYPSTWQDAALLKIQFLVNVLQDLPLAEKCIL
jgi:hypothetical protein